MSRLEKLGALCLLFASISCGPSESGRVGDGGIVDLPDQDGDGIADVHEGRDSGVDTDGDGTPDYLDDDSDGDGVPDASEGGDSLSGTPPVDSDADGTPDFQDTDSDDNGRPDGSDGTLDLDSDGIANFADLDDDGDGLLDTVEIADAPADPPDADGDGDFDFQDIDSDGDVILDADELLADPDADGLPAYLDLDADGDCIADTVESGDTDLDTAPIDTDADGQANFIDIDSDNDGLADGAEDSNCDGIVDAGETSSVAEDSDGDGVSDLVESVAGTDPNSNTDNPAANGDFFFVVPYEAPTTPPEDTLEFRTSVQFADLYFSIDTTGSMDEEIAALSASTGIPAIINDLTCDVLGGVCTLDGDCAAGVCFGGTCIDDPGAGTGCVPDLFTGVATFDDHDTFANLQSLQADPMVTANALPSGTGSGSAEAVTQSTQCTADGTGCTSSSKNCAASGIGCPGFRSNAVRILIQVTDADNQCGSACPTVAQAGAAMVASDIKFIGLFGTDDDSSSVSGTPQDLAESLGLASNTVDANGDAFVYAAEDAAVVAETKSAVLDIVQNLPLDTTIDKADEPGDDGDSLQFIDYVEVNISGAGNCSVVDVTADTDGDTRDDAFPALRPGTPVCWDVHPVLSNSTVPATEAPQLFVAKLTVLGDGSPLDSRQVFFLVPPALDGIPID